CRLTSSVEMCSLLVLASNPIFKARAIPVPFRFIFPETDMLEFSRVYSQTFSQIEISLQASFFAPGLERGGLYMDKFAGFLQRGPADKRIPLQGRQAESNFAGDIICSTNRANGDLFAAQPGVYSGGLNSQQLGEFGDGDR